jgi:hypothetical protein
MVNLVQWMLHQIGNFDRLKSCLSEAMGTGLSSMPARLAGSPLTSQRCGKRSRKKIISSAAFGEFAMATLKASIKALASNDASDATYNSIEGQIESLTKQRGSLASQMIVLLDAAEFNGQTFSTTQAQSLITQGQALLNQANAFPH